MQVKVTLRLKHAPQSVGDLGRYAVRLDPPQTGNDTLTQEWNYYLVQTSAVAPANHC